MYSICGYVHIIRVLLSFFYVLLSFLDLLMSIYILKFLPQNHYYHDYYDLKGINHTHPPSHP